MSDEMEGVFGSAPDGRTGAASTADTAKAEAADVKDTAVDAAKDVAGTAKAEAGAVLDEARANATDLYHQSRRELSDQAATQQQRLSSGLRSTAEDLENMARHANPSGVAGDMVHRIAQRLEGASTWLSQRDPEGVVAEVKAFARRRPGAFIFGALAAGVVAGRLTRALASAASSDSTAARMTTTPIATRRTDGVVTSDPAGQEMYGVAGSTGADAPLYAETVTRRRDERDEGWNERPDAV